MSLSRKEFLALTAAAAVALQSGIARAQDDSEPEEDAPPPPRGKKWLAVLGSAVKLKCEEPVLVKARFLDKDDTLMEEEKLYVRWEGTPKNGRWVILSAICTHLKCKVDYVGDESIFRCPCHKSEFELDGSVLRKPAKRDLSNYSEDAYVNRRTLYLLRDPS